MVRFHDGDSIFTVLQVTSTSLALRDRKGLFLVVPSIKARTGSHLFVISLQFLVGDFRGLDYEKIISV